ncbi:MAG: hypothetical protein LBJ02_11220 [Bifidobacteriaceae bacterium]|jgi:hypothetical protein|nr:hypothetical protein [Bifidobacteriaceae bacterium]
MSVIAYHGTSTAAALSIDGGQIKFSQNKYDWLGDGAYFFESGRSRASDWAAQLHPAGWAVFEASISTAGSLDLADPASVQLMTWEERRLRREHEERGEEVPGQLENGNHNLDRLVINRLCEHLEAAGIQVKTVRGVFQEGDPPYPGSALHGRSHVQIAVRDLDAIHGLKVVSTIQNPS